MYPRIYNSSDELLAVLDNVISESAKVKRVVNGEFTFAFSAYEKELKSAYFATDNYILLDDQTFDVKYIEQKHEIDVIYKLQCEHAIYRLEDGVANQYDTYAFTGTPAAMLADILAGTDFSVGTIDFATPITITVNNEISKKKLITQIANAVGGELDFTGNGFTINILATIGANNGFEVRFGKNLKAVTKIIDSRGELKTYYSIDMIALKNTNEYIEQGLQALEVVEVGDTIKIIDSVIGLDIENRILSIEYDPIVEVNTRLEIVNTIELITDSINEIETRSVIKETLYNGVYIGPTDGFVAERSDGKAKAVLNATVGLSMFTDNDGGGYVENLKVTTGGDIEMSGIIHISGGTGFSNLTGVGVLAGLDSVNGTTIDNDSITTSKIFAGAVTTNKIFAGAVTTNEMTVTHLSGIAADLGTITAGTINAVTILGANIYGANIDIEEDVTIGQKLELLDPTNAVAVEMSAFQILTSGGLKNTLMLAESTVLNDGTGTYTVNNLERIDAFVDNAFFYGDLAVTGDIATAGYLKTERASSSGGYVYVDTIDGERSAVLGVNGSFSSKAGMLLLYNGLSAGSSSRLEAYVDSTNDKGVVSVYRGSVVTGLITSDTNGGYFRTRDTAGLESVYIGGNRFVLIYDGSEAQSVAIYDNATNGGTIDLKYGGSSMVTTRADASYGSFMFMNNEAGNEIVRLGGSVHANSCGRLNLSDELGNYRAGLRVSTTVGDGRLDLEDASGNLATVYFDGTNLRLLIGSTAYTLTKT